jgi:hypothetical protein
VDNDTEAIEHAILELVDKVPSLSQNDALGVLVALGRLADAIESGKAGRNGLLVR